MGTAGELREWLQEIAGGEGDDPGPLWQGILRMAEEQLSEARAERDRITRLLSQYRRSRLLPDDGEALKIRRHEAHLERSLYRALHELQRLQTARKGGPVPAPAVLDVEVSGAGPEN